MTGSVETIEVSFEVEGDRVVGLLRVPAGPSPRAGLVFLGPLTCVKEQAPGHYAEALARRGFVTLAFDNRHFGQSGGTPRQYEHPGKKVEDVRGALTFLASRSETAGLPLGAVGICAGAGYMSGAVAQDDRIAAFGTVAGFYHDADQQRAWMGGGYEAALLRGKAAREAFEQTGQAEQIPAVAKGNGDVAMPLDEAYEFYGTPRGAPPNYVNGFAVMSREVTLPWSARAFAPSIRVPTLMIHSENALAPALARQWFSALAGPKEERWMTSKGQIDFYDEPIRIEPAADALAEHFRQHLSG